MVGFSTGISKRCWGRVVIGGCLTLVGCSTIDATPFENAASSIEISAPSSVSAGESYLVEVRLDSADRGSVDQGSATEPMVASLAIDAGYGPRVIDQPVVDGRARFEVPAAEVAGSGLVRLDVQIGSLLATAAVAVEPEASVDPLALFLGPRTVLADGVDFSMIVAVPVDRFGNPVQSGTEVLFDIRRPVQNSTQQTATTDGLLAFAPITGGTTAGRTTVAASTGATAGPQQSFLQVAGMASPFQLTVSDEVPTADGVTLFEVETSQLVDRFGNELPDGTSVALDLRSLDGDQGDRGLRRLWASTIEGKGLFVVEAPTMPGRVELVAYASGATSEATSIQFEPAVSEFSAIVTQQLERDERVWVIDIGPVVSSNGGYVADGTPAEVTIDGTTLTVSLENGWGSLIVDFQPVDLQVSVLGIDGGVETDQ